MGFVQYAAGRASRKNSLIREDSGKQWACRVSNKKSPPSTALEEEIYHLRIRMEEIFVGEQCLTAPTVVEVSTMLDKKILEYMNRKKCQGS